MIFLSFFPHHKRCIHIFFNPGLLPFTHHTTKLYHQKHKTRPREKRKHCTHHYIYYHHWVCWWWSLLSVCIKLTNYFLHSNSSWSIKASSFSSTYPTSLPSLDSQKIQNFFQAMYKENSDKQTFIFSSSPSSLTQPICSNEKKTHKGELGLP